MASSASPSRNAASEDVRCVSAARASRSARGGSAAASASRAAFSTTSGGSSTPASNAHAETQREWRPPATPASTAASASRREASTSSNGESSARNTSAYKECATRTAPTGCAPSTTMSPYPPSFASSCPSTTPRAIASGSGSPKATNASASRSGCSSSSKRAWTRSASRPGATSGPRDRHRSRAWWSEPSSIAARTSSRRKSRFPPVSCQRRSTVRPSTGPPSAFVRSTSVSSRDSAWSSR